MDKQQALEYVIKLAKANALMDYRIDELTKKVEKHNNVVERMALQEQQTKTMWKKIDDIQEELKNLEHD